MPPSRDGALAWWGNDNKFYLFGGARFDPTFSLSDLWVFNPDTNCVSLCNALIVAPPVANFQSNKSAICENDCINFTDKSANATSWQWNFGGGSPSISTIENPQVCYLTSGIYNVTLVASNSGGSDTLSINNYITVNAAPTPPIVKQINDTVLNFTPDSSYISYQWYLDSAIVPNATDTFLIISKSGNYNVQVANVNGCKIAAGINIILGIQNFSNDNIISLYPNPATDELLISGNWKSATGNLIIFNVLGEAIYASVINRKQVRRTLDFFGETINCKLFPAGIYFVQVVNESGRWTGRFVKE
jgi:hypothetical protein